MSGNSCSSIDNFNSSNHQWRAGDRVQVYWKDDRAWYTGTLTKEKRRREAIVVYVEYDDGEEEWLNVQRHKIRPFQHKKKKQDGDQDAAGGGGIGLVTKKKQQHKKNKDAHEDSDDRIPRKERLLKEKKKAKKSRSDSRVYEDASESEGDNAKLVTIGDRIEVWWALERTFFAGKVTRHKGSKHYIEYDDGDTEWKDLSRYTFRFLPDKHGNKKGGGTHKKVPVSKSSHSLVDSDESDGEGGAEVEVKVEKRKRGRPRKYPIQKLEAGDDERPQLKYKKRKVEVEPDVVVAVPTPASSRKEQNDDRVVSIVGEDKAGDVKPSDDGGDKTYGILGRDDTVPLGSRVEVSCWSDTFEKEWFSGIITKQSGRKYYVEYDDGETDWIAFHRQEVQLISSGGDKAGEEISQAEESSLAYPQDEVERHDHDDDDDDDAMEQDRKEHKKDHSDITVGSLVEVWNSEEKAYLAGVVKRQKKGHPHKFFVKYDNGEKDLVDFRRVRYRLLGTTAREEGQKEKQLAPKRVTTPTDTKLAAGGSTDMVVMTTVPKKLHLEKSKANECFVNHPSSPEGAKDVVSFSENSDNGDGADDRGISKKGEVAIGSRVEIWWTLDKQYFPGTVTKKDGLKYFVEYDSGEHGWVDSSQVDVRLLDGGMREDGVPANITMKLEESCDEMDSSGHEQTTKNPPILQEGGGKRAFGQKATSIPDVGARVEVWSPAKKQFCPGEVIRTGALRFLVEYDHNGGRGWVSMRQEQKFRFLSNGDVFEDELSDEDDEDDEKGKAAPVASRGLRKMDVARKVSEAASVLETPILRTVEIEHDKNDEVVEAGIVAQIGATKGKKDRKKKKKPVASKLDFSSATIIDSGSSDDEKKHHLGQERRRIKLKGKGRQ